MATASSTSSQSAFPGLPRDPQIPSSIIDQDLLSPTALAGDCFIFQRFSNRLQSYLIDYVSQVYNDYPIYH